jgi:hypothetical protein
MNNCTKLRVGELVVVRSKEEILRTLNNRGQKEALPFMPEMFQYCGKRFKVFKRAHKTCDPPNGLCGRRMQNAVHLEGVRCDGQNHGGCQAGCLIFWKEAWLERVDPAAPRHSDQSAVDSRAISQTPGCTEEDVMAGALAADSSEHSQDPVYVCQSTHLASATLPLAWWDLRQYVEDYTSGNVELSQFLTGFLFFIYHYFASAGLGLGSAMLWAYDRFQKIRGGTPYPWRIGKIPPGHRTPSVKLDLQPGDVVKVKTYREILETLDEASCNRGMYFDAEEVPFCNGTYRVLRRVEQIIDEKTGKMLKLKSDAIILDGVYCLAHYAKYRRFCPRSIYAYWREAWLERIPGIKAAAGAEDRRKGTESE